MRERRGHPSTEGGQMRMQVKIQRERSSRGILKESHGTHVRVRSRHKQSAKQRDTGFLPMEDFWGVVMPVRGI